MAAYYNEIDPSAAAWLRELIKTGEIADGEVDERDIRDVPPDDLRAFRQLHLFAGIGGWSAALRLAGWPDDRPCLTVSCPCPSFSAAGAGRGFADERHLWPAAFWLIDQLRPPVVMGEQVEAAIAHWWLDLVCDDLEGIGYACRAIVLPACSVGAPHLRQRLWFVAESERAERGSWRPGRTGTNRRRPHVEPSGSGDAGRMADADHAERRPLTEHRGHGRDWQDRGRTQAHGEPGTCGEVHVMADPQSGGQRIDRGASGDTRHVDEREPVESVGHAERQRLQGLTGDVGDRDESGRLGADAAGSVTAASDVGLVADPHEPEPSDGGLQRSGRLLQPAEDAPAGFWSDLVWLPCRDGKSRPIHRDIKPLVERRIIKVPDGVPGGVVPGGDPSASQAQATTEARVMRLRGYGNSVVPQVGAEVIRAYMEFTLNPHRIPLDDVTQAPLQ